MVANSVTDERVGSLRPSMLDATGAPLNPRRSVQVGDGSGARGLVQQGSHPRQIILHAERVSVPDYGAGWVRVMEVESAED